MKAVISKVSSCFPSLLLRSKEEEVVGRDDIVAQLAGAVLQGHHDDNLSVMHILQSTAHIGLSAPKITKIWSVLPTYRMDYFHMPFESIWTLFWAFVTAGVLDTIEYIRILT